MGCLPATAKTKTIQLPWPLLKLVDRLDRLLVAVAPGLFALGRSVVLQRV